MEDSDVQFNVDESDKRLPFFQKRVIARVYEYATLLKSKIKALFVCFIRFFFLSVFYFMFTNRI